MTYKKESEKITWAELGEKKNLLKKEGRRRYTDAERSHERASLSESLEK